MYVEIYLSFYLFQYLHNIFLSIIFYIKQAISTILKVNNVNSQITIKTISNA